MKRNEQNGIWETETGEPAITVVPLKEATGDNSLKALLDLQLRMATNSINHEYARVEFDDTNCPERREELLDYMQDCRSQYFTARGELEAYDPYALAEFEEDLLSQKQRMLAPHYNA